MELITRNLLGIMGATASKMPHIDQAAAPPPPQQQQQQQRCTPVSKRECSIKREYGGDTAAAAAALHCREQAGVGGLQGPQVGHKALL